MPYNTPERFPCPFCESFANRLDYVRLVESKYAVAEISDCERSINGGSTLVWPKRHVERISQLSEDQAVDIIHVVFRASAGVLAALKPQGMHTFCSAGTLVGQSEAHMHVQIQPRYSDRPYSFAPAKELPTIPLSVREQMAERIRPHLSDLPQDMSQCSFMPFRSSRLIENPHSLETQLERSLIAAKTKYFVAMCHPQSRGYGALIVVPRRDVPCFLALSAAERIDFILLVRKLAQTIEKALDPDGLSVWWDTGAEAKQPGAQFIAEIVPRFESIPYKHVPRESMPIKDPTEDVEAAALYRHILDAECLEPA